jgi:hypothetical protein
LFFVDFEQVISNSVLRFGPKHCIAFNVHLQLELRVLSCGNILCDILQDYKIDKFANKLSVMHILTSVLLGVVQYLVVDDTCSHVKGWFQDFNVTRNTYNLVQRKSVHRILWQLAKLHRALIISSDDVRLCAQDVEFCFGSPNEPSGRKAGHIGSIGFQSGVSRQSLLENLST